MEPTVWPEQEVTLQERLLPDLLLAYTLVNDRVEAVLSIASFPPDQDVPTLVGLIRQSVLCKFPHKASLAFLGEELPKLVAERKGFHGKVVARGTPAQHGKDGYVEFLVRRPSREFLLKPDGTFDFQTRDLFRHVRAGEPVLILHPPTPGHPGTDALNRAILPRPGRPSTVLAGKNVSLATNQEGNTIARADCPGQVHFEVKSLAVKARVTAVLEHPGDLDPAAGTVNFKGSMVVQGSVLSGASLIVTGNLTVHGTIRSGAKVTVGGDLVVGKGIFGEGPVLEETPEIKAFGNIRAFAVENAKVTAEGDLFVNSAIESWLSSSGAIYIENQLVGGQALAFQAVEAGAIGSDRGDPTEVSSGISHSVRARLNLVLKILGDLKHQVVELEQEFGLLTVRGDKLEPEKRHQLEQALTQKRDNLQKQILSLELKMADQALSLLEENQATISARAVHPGTVLVIRSSSKKIDRLLTGAVFYQKMPEELIAVRPYRP